MYFRTPKEAAIWCFAVGILAASMSLYFHVTRWTQENLLTDDLRVMKAGFEKFPTRSTYYYEYAIYSDKGRFFLRSPDRIELSKSVPYLEKGNMVQISHNGRREGDRGVRIVQIEKDGRVRYSLVQSAYQRDMGIWFSACAAVFFIFMSSLFYVYGMKNES